MRLVIMGLAVMGGLAAGAFGAKWVSDAGKAKDLMKLAEELGVAKEEMAQLKSVERAGYLLMLSMVAGFGGAVATYLGKPKLACGLLLGAGLLPALFTLKALVPGFLLLVAGGLNFALKPDSPTVQSLGEKLLNKAA